MLVALCASACSLLPRPDGTASDSTSGLDGLARSYGVRPLDPAASSLLIEQAARELKKTDPGHRLQGTTYELTRGNQLRDDWLIQSPDLWGHTAEGVAVQAQDCEGCEPDLQLPACNAGDGCQVGRCAALKASVVRPGQKPRRFCLGHSDALVDRFYDVIVSAHERVDIAMLQPPADGRFLAALRNALTYLAASRRAVTVRVIVGSYPPSGTDALVFLEQLVRDARNQPGSRLRIAVGTIRSCNDDAQCSGLSWNHAKILAADGTRAIVGGHNMWTGDYLTGAPVHDLSMELHGPAAGTAHRFASALWRYVCGRPEGDTLNTAYAFSLKHGVARGCIDEVGLPPAHAAGSIPVLSIGRLGKGMIPEFTDQSLVARTLLLGSARHAVRMIQQDVAFAVSGIDPIWPDAVLERLSDLITSGGGDVYIVLSNLGAAGAIGHYSYGVALETVASRLMQVAQRRSHHSHRVLVKELCQHFHLAPLRFGPDATWPGNKPIAVHTKFWMVDDRLFYIGSENLYPATLQEFGYVVEDRAATARVRTDLWDQAWKWSQQAAISGAEAPACVFESKRTAAHFGRS
jgi:phosphatidylserine/phosphatidylglycerophosphate/cardiolipin synthase-like enzyme